MATFILKVLRSNNLVFKNTPYLGAILSSPVSVEQANRMIDNWFDNEDKKVQVLTLFNNNKYYRDLFRRTYLRMGILLNYLENNIKITNINPDYLNNMLQMIIDHILWSPYNPALLSGHSLDYFIKLSRYYYDKHVIGVSKFELITMAQEYNLGHTPEVINHWVINTGILIPQWVPVTDKAESVYIYKWVDKLIPESLLKIDPILALAYRINKLSSDNYL